MLHLTTALSNDSAPRPEVRVPPSMRTSTLAVTTHTGGDPGRIDRLGVLHRVYGNQAVLRALDQSKPAAPSVWSGQPSGGSALIPGFSGSATVGHLLQRQPAKEKSTAAQPKQTKTPDGVELGPTNTFKTFCPKGELK